MSDQNKILPSLYQYNSKQASDENKEKYQLVHLLVDLKPNSPNYHYNKSMTNNKENY